MHKIFMVCSLLLISFICNSQELLKHGGTSISVSLGQYQTGDTIVLEIWNDLIGDGLSPYEKEGLFHRSFESSLTNGKTQFNLESVSKHAYFNLRLKNEQRNTKGGWGIWYLLTSYLIESGDRLKIDFDSINTKKSNYITLSIVQSVGFSGKGSEKLQCKYLTDSAATAVADSLVAATPKSVPSLDSLKIYKRYQYWAKRNRDFIYRINCQLQIVESFRSTLSPFIYNVLRGNIIGSSQLNYRIIKSDFERPEGWLQQTIMSSSLKETIRAEARVAIREIYKDSISEMAGLTISTEAKIYSASYISMLLAKIKADVVMLYPETSIYERIKARYSGALRDRILTWYISGRRDNPEQRDIDLQNALSIVKDPACLKELVRIKNSTNVGAKAFVFSLKNRKGKTVSSSDLLGKVVFIDFWYTGCGFCAKYYSDILSKVEDHYKTNREVVFVTVSIDKEISMWTTSLNKGNYTSAKHPNVINLYTNGLGLNHPLILHYRIPSYPYLLLIDKQGRIANNSQEELRGYGSDYQSVIKKIDEVVKR